MENPYLNQTILGTSLGVPVNNDTSINSRYDVNSRLWAAAERYLPAILLSSLTSRRDVAPWIEPIEGSLLLADISGFTPMTEKLAESGKEGAEWLTNIVNQYFERMLDIARERGGIHLKFGGDALLLFFQGEHSAPLAVSTALEMQKATRSFRSFQAGHDRFRLRMTVGVHSASFYSAAVGLPHQHMQYFVIGPETNRLAQIQSLAQPGELIVSRDTIDALGLPCLFEPRGVNYRIIRLIGGPSLPHGVSGTQPTPAASEAVAAYLPEPLTNALRSGATWNAEGEHRKVTIVFINVAGLNELLESGGANALLEELQRYMTILISLCTQFGGFIAGNDIASQGVKLILAFGAPLAHEHDTANALRLTLELNREIQARGLHLRNRTGIHCGYVFAGNVGSTYRRQYTVMGDAVNLSARLMGASLPDRILISAAAALDAGSSFITKELPPIKVKGKRNPVAIYDLQGERTATSFATAESKSALLGRQAEVQLFQKICQEMAGSGNGQTLYVVADAGIGKTRLLQEYRQLAESRGWRTHRGTCYSHTAAKPFAPWIELLNSLFDIRSEDNGELRNERVIAGIRRHAPELVEFAPLLNSLLDLTIAQTDVVRSLVGDNFRSRLFNLITALMTATAVTKPFVMFIEDLHWADPSSLSLVNHVARSIRSHPVLLCISSRAKEAPQLQLPEDTILTMHLGELPEDLAIKLVQTISGQSQLPGSVTTTILAKAKGNPLFLEEIAMSLRQAGTLDGILDVSTAKSQEQIESLVVPDRIQSLIMSRIDALDDSKKEILKTAAVIGSNFDLPTLGTLLSRVDRDEELNHYLDDLSQTDLVNREEGSYPITYRFRNTLIQEVAYSSLPYARRRTLHHDIASYIEGQHTGQSGMPYETLAHHYSISGDDPKTRYFCTKAGDKARLIFALEEATEYYNRGLATLQGRGADTLAQRSCFLERIGDCYDLSGRHKEAARTFSQALRQWRMSACGSDTWKMILVDLTDGMPTKVRESALHQKAAASLDRGADYKLALKRIELAQHALPPRHPSQAAKVYITRSLVLFHKAKYRQAIYWGHKGLAISRSRDNRRDLAFAHNIIANSYTTLGDLNKAIRHRRAAVSLYDELGDFVGQATANNNLGVCYQCTGNLDKALDAFYVSLKAAERVHHLTYVAIAHNNIGEILLAKGRLDEAADHLQTVVETFEEHGQTALYGVSLVNLSRTHQCRREYEKAFDCLNRGTEMIRKTGARGLMVEAIVQRADLQLEVNQLESAHRWCARALKETRELGMKLHEVRALLIQGRICLARGLYDQAEVQMRQSLALAKHINADHERGLALLWLARLCGVRRGNGRSAGRWQALLNQAMAILQRAGADADVARALQFEADVRQRRDFAKPLAIS